MKAVVAHIVENRGHDSRSLVIAANKVLVRVHEFRFVAEDGFRSEREKAAMLEPVVSSGSPVRLCEADCHDIAKTEMLLTFGRPERAEDGGLTILVEDYGVSDGSSGRRIVSYRLEEVEDRWSVTERRFVMASHSVRCPDPGRC